MCEYPSADPMSNSKDGTCLGCRWGNQSPELCHPFDEDGKLRLNCYMAAVQDVCCATCKRLRARMRDEIPGKTPILFRI